MQVTLRRNGKEKQVEVSEIVYGASTYDVEDLQELSMVNEATVLEWYVQLRQVITFSLDELFLYDDVACDNDSVNALSSPTCHPSSLL